MRNLSDQKYVDMYANKAKDLLAEGKDPATELEAATTTPRIEGGIPVPSGGPQAATPAQDPGAPSAAGQPVG